MWYSANKLSCRRLCLNYLKKIFLSRYHTCVCCCDKIAVRLFNSFQMVSDQITLSFELPI
jgi:hypothetical protein